MHVGRPRVCPASLAPTCSATSLWTRPVSCRTQKLVGAWRLSLHAWVVSAAFARRAGMRWLVGMANAAALRWAARPGSASHLVRHAAPPAASAAPGTIVLHPCPLADTTARIRHASPPWAWSRGSASVPAGGPVVESAPPCFPASVRHVVPSSLLEGPSCGCRLALYCLKAGEIGLWPVIASLTQPPGSLMRRHMHQRFMLHHQEQGDICAVDSGPGGRKGSCLQITRAFDSRGQCAANASQT